MLRDPRRWKDALFSLVQLPVTQAGFAVAVAAWATVLSLVSLPAWYWAVPSSDVLGALDVDTLPEAAAVAVLGVLRVPVAWGLTRGACAACVLLTRAVLDDA